MTFSAAVLHKGGKWLAPCPQRGVAFDRADAEVPQPNRALLERAGKLRNRTEPTAQKIAKITKNGRLSAGLSS